MRSTVLDISRPYGNLTKTEKRREELSSLHCRNYVCDRPRAGIDTLKKGFSTAPRPSFCQPHFFCLLSRTDPDKKKRDEPDLLTNHPLSPPSPSSSLSSLYPCTFLLGFSRPILVSRAILASFFLHDKLGIVGKVGCALCLIGSVVIVLHAPEDKNIESVDEILNYALQPGKTDHLSPPYLSFFSIHPSFLSSIMLPAWSAIDFIVCHGYIPGDNKAVPT